MVKSITSENFEQEVLKNEKPTLVKIYTNSCPNCRVLEPIVEATEADCFDKYSFYKLDAQENISIAKKYKVLGVPTLLFFSHGILVDKKTGVINQGKIEKRLLPLLGYTQEVASQNERKGFFKLPWK